ncbi:MAG: tyrosine-type recombinase/integrase [Methylocystis sp.]|uniref:tyrosine-type recombinase/integrase n=1 Tax=Methylocystis sp. TaxID=1911079 RepID=UPI003DA21CF6
MWRCRPRFQFARHCESPRRPPHDIRGYDATDPPGDPADDQPHGLRKAAGRRLAEAGCSAKEIMAILGHKTMSEAQRRLWRSPTSGNERRGYHAPGNSY